MSFVVPCVFTREDNYRRTVGPHQAFEWTFCLGPFCYKNPTSSSS
ncbi:unnamed protein product [Arabidopsis halleri]